jgi:hypothetical protein
MVNLGHMSYDDSFKPAATWLAGKVAAHKSKGGA